MKKFLILSIIASMLGLTGCGSSPSPDDSNEMVLNHVLGTKIRGLDPVNMRDVYSMMVGSQMMETLFQYHFLKRPYELMPLLAEQMPQVSDDMLSYTIKIKEGIYFQDDPCFKDGRGRELVADDFVYAIKRIANVKNISQNWSIFDDKIVGLDEFRDYTKTVEKGQLVDYSKRVEGLYADDDHTLVIKLKKPWPQILSTALADTSTAPIAHEAVEYYGKDIVSHPVGTGAYMLKTWNRGSFIELVKNPNFRDEFYPSEGGPGDIEAGYLDDAGRKLPFADRVIWTIIEESQPAWFLFLQGKVDASAIPKDNFGEAITDARELTPKMQELNIHLKTFVDPSTFCVGFNMLDPVLGKNKPLRKAISRAVEREKFIELFTNDRDEIAHGFVAPLMDSYDPNIKDHGYSRYDPNEAKELLKEAETVNGGPIPVLTISMPGTDTFARQYGEFLKMQLNDIGLEIKVDYTDWPTYLEKINTRSAQMFASGWSASIPDGIDFLQTFYSKNWSPGSNSFNYKNDEFDALMVKAEVMPSSPERIELYRKMELIVLEDYPAVFMNHRVAYALHHDWYKNYKPHVFSYGLSKYRRVDLEKRNNYKKLLREVK